MAKSVGQPICITGKGNSTVKYYSSFELEGDFYELGDSVLVCSAERKKPYIAIIRDVREVVNGDVMFTGQWLYRPEEAGKKGGRSWKPRDSRELFYSFHLYEAPAASVMHKCIIHFIPLHKRLPDRTEHPGFVVQRVYDVVGRNLWEITDSVFQDNKRHEIDLLVQKTRERIGELPDLVAEDYSVHQDDHLESESLGRKDVAQIDISRIESTTRLGHSTKKVPPGKKTSGISRYHTILDRFKVLTDDRHRDKWLEKLLQGTQHACNSTIVESTGGTKIHWPNSYILKVSELERVTYEAFGTDFQKYNQKMRQLDFNLKNNPLLARRLLSEELEPIALLTMNPDELKEGLTADERIIIEPEMTEQMQMTDARCSICLEKQVGVSNIIQAGMRGDRYQLGCVACGHTWFASRDEFP